MDGKWLWQLAVRGVGALDRQLQRAYDLPLRVRRWWRWWDNDNDVYAGDYDYLAVSHYNHAGNHDDDNYGTFDDDDRAYYVDHRGRFYYHDDTGRRHYYDDHPPVW